MTARASDDPSDVPGAPSHPGPASGVLPRHIRDAMVAWARAEYPNEMCGVISGSANPAAGGVAREWHATRNAAASPMRYEIATEDLLRLALEIEDVRGEVIWGIAHSHVRSSARPSPTDVGLAVGWPDALYLLVSLSPAEADPATGGPSVRAWRIAGGAVHEVALEVR